jgi:hypothetical protein
MGRQEKKKAGSGDVGDSVGSLADLNRELFQAAVNLRGSIEPADYKRSSCQSSFCGFSLCVTSVAVRSWNR